jgi:hypothetical protein
MASPMVRASASAVSWSRIATLSDCRVPPGRRGAAGQGRRALGSSGLCPAGSGGVPRVFAGAGQGAWRSAAAGRPSGHPARASRSHGPRRCRSGCRRPAAASFLRSLQMNTSMILISGSSIPP